MTANPGNALNMTSPGWATTKILAEFGVDREGMIVNGHVPVKVEKGESPLKKSGKAVTIDGAFSQAYGDHGFTLVLEPRHTFIATHHKFESVQAAIEQGADIVPSRTVVREWEQPRRVDASANAGSSSASPLSD